MNTKFNDFQTSALGFTKSPLGIIALFIVLIISLIVTFILDTIISHKIYKARANKYGDILTIFNILSFGLLRPIFLFILRNK